MQVKFTKYFETGTLQGLTFDTTIQVSSLDEANQWMRFAHEHFGTTVQSVSGSDYTIFGARIVSES